MTVLRILQLLGGAVFAASGALAAGRKRMDLLGVLVIALVTSIGGGTIRDLLLDRPVFWITDPAFLSISLIAAIVTLVYVRWWHPPEKALEIADALGLGLFTIGGTQIALAAGAPGIVAVVMGTITGVAGGAIRDVLSAEIPLILRKGELYATAAIAGSLVYLGLVRGGVPESSAAAVGMITTIALRFAAIAWGLSLPVFRLRDPR